MDGEKELVDVLSAMRTYFLNQDSRLHLSVGIGYCRACEAVVKVAGGSRSFLGRDCEGEHYKSVEGPESCLSCNSTAYLSFQPKDITGVKTVPADKFIAAIEKGLDGMKFPGQYNWDLPEIAEVWRRLQPSEKQLQVESLLEKNQRIASRKEELRGLEISVGA